MRKSGSLARPAELRHSNESSSQSGTCKGYLGTLGMFSAVRELAARPPGHLNLAATVCAVPRRACVWKDVHEGVVQ